MANPNLPALNQSTKTSAIAYARAWGDSSVPPAVLATLIASQHLRPPQFLPLMFSPVLLFSSYLNVRGYKVDAAGTSAAWSGLYFLLARRRRHPLMKRWSFPGLIRGSTMGLCVVNFVAGGCAYVLGKRKHERSEDRPLV